MRLYQISVSFRLINPTSSSTGLSRPRKSIILNGPYYQLRPAQFGGQLCLTYDLYRFFLTRWSSNPNPALQATTDFPTDLFSRGNFRVRLASPPNAAEARNDFTLCLSEGVGWSFQKIDQIFELFSFFWGNKCEGLEHFAFGGENDHFLRR